MGFEKFTAIGDDDFGDTGKGKLGDFLCLEHDVVVRSLGGGNAGHWGVHGEKKAATHVLPIAALHEHPEMFLGRGMVTHIPTIYSDAEAVDKEFHTDPLKRVYIAEENHILFEEHKKIDGVMESRREGLRIGTTGSGIGPAYADKALRVGMRFGELKESKDYIKDRYQGLRRHWKATFEVELDSTAEEKQLQWLLRVRKEFGKENRIVGTYKYWQNHYNNRARVLLEGAQGANLSIDSEGYPFVTSSPTNVTGHLQGAGLRARDLTEVILTAKAYKTRVGGGPLPTKILDPQLVAMLTEKGIEKGATTGRVRQVAWLDAFELAQRSFEDSFGDDKTSLAILKMDLFDGVPEIQLAIDRDEEGNPVYELQPGWNNTNGVRKYDALHPYAQQYLQRISGITRTRIGYVGTGRDMMDLIKI